MRIKEKNELIRIREQLAYLIRKYDNGNVFDVMEARELLIKIDILI